MIAKIFKKVVGSGGKVIGIMFRKLNFGRVQNFDQKRLLSGIQFFLYSTMLETEMELFIAPALILLPRSKGGGGGGTQQSFIR